MNTERKNKLRLVLLAVLLLATMSLIFYMQKPAADLVDPSLFQVAELEKIDRIVLESKAGKVDLHFINGQWKVNDQFEADRRLVTVLFSTIEKARPKREVSKSNADSVHQQLLRSGIAVSMFEGDKVRKKFIAGGNAQKTEAYFQLEDDSYLITIPGYRVYVSGIFEADESMWRVKRIFNFNWRNFKSLSSTFVSDKKESFQIHFKGNYFGIDDIAQVDTTRVNDYLDAVSLLDAQEFLGESKMVAYDSLLKTNPSIIVEVKDIADRAYVLEVFPPVKGIPVVIGRYQGTDVALFDLKAIVAIAKKKAYFRQKD